MRERAREYKHNRLDKKKYKKAVHRRISREMYRYFHKKEQKNIDDRFKQL